MLRHRINVFISEASSRRSSVSYNQTSKDATVIKSNYQQVAGARGWMAFDVIQLAAAIKLARRLAAALRRVGVRVIVHQLTRWVARRCNILRQSTVRRPARPASIQLLLRVSAVH